MKDKMEFGIQEKLSASFNYKQIFSQAEVQFLL